MAKNTRIRMLDPIEQPSKKTHTCGDCRHCKPTDKHLSNRGKSILGACPYSKYLVLLSDFKICSYYEEKDKQSDDR